MSDRASIIAEECGTRLDQESISFANVFSQTISDSRIDDSRDQIERIRRLPRLEVDADTSLVRKRKVSFY